MEKKLRWGILGTAAIAPAMVRGIRSSSNGTVAAVASRDAARAEQWAEAHGVPHAFGSYEALIGSGEVDVIYNPLPNSLHACWTIRALEAGLPVLCEKPFTANAAEARQVLAARDRTGQPVAEAFMYRFHPLYAAVLERVRDGAVGDVIGIQSTFTWFLDDRTEIPASAELAGGALMDVGCYPVNFARLITGGEPTRAAAFQRGKDIDDTFVGLLDFPNGVLAQIECSIESYERTRAEIVGTRGTLVIDAPWIPGEEQATFVVRNENGVVEIGGSK